MGRPSGILPQSSHDLINCSQNTRLNSVILGLSLENSHGRLYKKFLKRELIITLKSHNNNFPSVVFTLLRCVYGCRWPACACVRVCAYIYTKPRQQKFRAMNGAHLASPIRGELGYAHWPQLGTQFIALLGTKFGS